MKRLRKEFWRIAYVRVELPVYRRWGTTWQGAFFLKHLKARERYFRAIVKMKGKEK